MKKTSVYLTDEEAEGLRQASKATGRSQAELIRDGVRHMLDVSLTEERRFHSLGKGHGGGDRYRPWAADDVYAEAMGCED